MIKNYLLSTFRNFARNRNYTLINVLGLSIGVMACIAIFLIISYDLRFDTFHRHYDQLYRVVKETSTASGSEHESSTPYPFATAFREDFPDILITEFHHHPEGVITLQKEKTLVENILFADSLFFKVFSFEVVSGNPYKDLGEPGKVFLTLSAADKLNANLHDRIKINNTVDAEVVGFVQDPPASSHIQYSMIVSWPSFTEEFFGLPVTEWNLNASGYSYIVLPESVSPSQLNERITSFTQKFRKNDKGRKEEYYLQPMADVHFNTTFTNVPGPEAIDSSRLVTLAVLGIFILLIACINYVNLATALAIKKSKEIGIRKTLGARRPQLALYFLMETFVITLIAVLISLGLIEWSLPSLNNFVEKKLVLDLIGDVSLVTFLSMILFTTTFLSGFYPAIVLSGFDPIAVLKNKITGQSSSGSFVRKFLVVFQFTIAQMLIVGTVIVANQMDYFRTKPLGFEKEALINVPVPDDDASLIESFRTRLMSHGAVESVSFAIGPPTADNNIETNFFLSELGPDQLYKVEVKPVDIRYKDAYGLQMKAGRWFSEGEEKLMNGDLPKEEQQYVLVVNESAAKQLGFSNAEELIGKSITIGLNRISAPVIGVVEDFHNRPLTRAIQPVVLLSFPYFYSDAGIKIKTDRNMQETLRDIEELWSSLYPEYYFNFEFLDEQLANNYRQEERTFTLFKVFSAIAIFIGCLGLYGLISFMANQKLKEIGIRKVMGASVPSIVSLFSIEFIKLILIAFIIAAPFSGYLMGQWLEGFAYRIDIHWSVFVIGLALTLVIAMITVSYRSVRAAMTNPVDTLRSE